MSEDKITAAERLGSALPPVLLIGAIALWLIPSALSFGRKPSQTQLTLSDPIVYAVGAAEGTRTCDGGKTKAYDRHQDPGDKKSNAGTFSAAPRGNNGIRAAMSPEERDAAYLITINQAIATAPKMDRIRLANYVDLVVQAHPDVSKDFARSSGDLVEDRVQAFQGQSWTTEDRLRQDQRRRADRIKECLG